LTSSDIKALENDIEFSCQMCGSCFRGFNEGEVYFCSIRANEKE